MPRQCSKENKTSTRNPTSLNGLRRTFKLPLFVPYLVALKKVTTAPLADVIWAAFLSLSLLSLSLSPSHLLLFSALFIPPDCGRRCRLAKINGQRFGGVILERRKEGSVYEALPRHSGVGITVEKIVLSKTHHIVQYLPSQRPMLSHVLRQNIHSTATRKKQWVGEPCESVCVWDGQ